MINGSQKNEQELKRVQEADNERSKPNVVLDITVPKKRWSYNAPRLERIYYQFPYASNMESQTASTAQQRKDWANKKAE